MAVDAALERFGRLDAVVANAGITLAKTVDETTDAELERLLAVNVKSVVYLAQAAHRPLARSRGAFVVVASNKGLVAQRGSPVYVATKGAVVQLARALALDWAPEGIRVNAVCPGLVDTEMLRSFAAVLAGPGRHAATRRGAAARAPRGAGRVRERRRVPGLARSQLHHRSRAAGGRRVHRAVTEACLEAAPIRRERPASDGSLPSDGAARRPSRPRDRRGRRDRRRRRPGARARGRRRAGRRRRGLPRRVCRRCDRPGRHGSGGGRGRRARHLRGMRRRVADGAVSGRLAGSLARRRGGEPPRRDGGLPGVRTGDARARQGRAPPGRVLDRGHPRGDRHRGLRREQGGSDRSRSRPHGRAGGAQDHRQRGRAGAGGHGHEPARRGHPRAPDRPPGRGPAARAPGAARARPGASAGPARSPHCWRFSRRTPPPS